MSLTPADVEFLLSVEGARASLDLASQNLSDSQTLPILTRLRRTMTPEQAGAVLLTARLRQKAVAKFGDDAMHMLFTPDGLEQASDPLIRRYRAEQAQGQTALDVCCGIGTDSFALGQSGKKVIGFDRSMVRLEIAKWNAIVLNLVADVRPIRDINWRRTDEHDTVRFEERDVMQGLPDAADIIFYDPARRDDTGRRIFGVEVYEPPLSLIKAWSAPLKAVKLAPGVDLLELHEYRGGVEFLSVEGDLKEAVLWIGAGWQGTKATLFADGQVYHWQRQGVEPEINTAAPRAYVCEPDSSILRAGLVQDLAAEINATMLDSTIAYLSTEAVPQSPWVRTWRIRDWMPFNLKKLRAHLREQDIGRVTVKKRGFPMSPEELQSALKLKGKAACTLVCTRFNGDPIVMICDEMPVKTN